MGLLSQADSPPEGLGGCHPQKACLCPQCPEEQVKPELLSVHPRKDAKEPGIVSLGFVPKALVVQVCSQRRLTAQEAAAEYPSELGLKLKVFRGGLSWDWGGCEAGVRSLLCHGREMWSSGSLAVLTGCVIFLLLNKILDKSDLRKGLFLLTVEGTAHRVGEPAAAPTAGE